MLDCYFVYVIHRFPLKNVYACTHAKAVSFLERDGWGGVWMGCEEKYDIFGFRGRWWEHFGFGVGGGDGSRFKLNVHFFWTFS